MKKIIIPIIIASCTITSGCHLSEYTSELKPKISVIGRDGFTSTQRYQILSWTIKSIENYRGNSYRCSAGHKTVGWGFNSKATGIKSVENIQEADVLFRDIIESLYKEVNNDFPQLSYLQKASIVSLMYNTGPNIKNSQLYAKLKNNDIEGAVMELHRWNKVKNKFGRKVVNKGLIRRRQLEAKLLNNDFTMDDYHKLKLEVERIYAKQS
jgi:GH24 family phage-related lysozyme (muramidase)